MCSSSATIIQPTSQPFRKKPTHSENLDIFLKKLKYLYLSRFWFSICPQITHDPPLNCLNQSYIRKKQHRGERPTKSSTWSKFWLILEQFAFPQRVAWENSDTRQLFSLRDLDPYNGPARKMFGLRRPTCDQKQNELALNFRVVSSTKSNTLGFNGVFAGRFVVCSLAWKVLKAVPVSE